MRPIPLFLVGILALLVAPQTIAAPLGGAGTAQVEVTFSMPGYYSRCTHLTAIAYEYVNSRLLVDIQSPYYVRTDEARPRTDTECAISFIVHAGTIVNPCDMPHGRTSPSVVPTNPYFDQVDPNSPTWKKYVTFPNGGWVDFRIQEDRWPGSTSTMFYGWCQSGEVVSSFGAHFHRTRLG